MRLNPRFAFVLVVSCVALGALAAGCNSSGPAGTYADLQWVIRCEVMRGCTAYPSRDVLGFDGENGVRLSCQVNESGANRTLTFSAFAPSYGLQLQNATFPRAGGAPAAGGCQVRVLDDNNYVGACGGSPPGEGQPCTVNNVVFDRDDEGRSRISGSIYCVGLSPEAAPSIDRELTTPGTDPASRTTPMQFTLYDCPGYNPD